MRVRLITLLRRLWDPLFNNPMAFPLAFAPLVIVVGIATDHSATRLAALTSAPASTVAASSQAIGLRPGI